MDGFRCQKKQIIDPNRNRENILPWNIEAKY